MIIKKLVLLFFLSCFSIFCQSQETPKTLRVISYNIWNGFDWGKDTARNQQFIDWVKFQKPDVLALQELCGYTQEKLLSQAEQWGHEHAVILKTEGYPVGLTSKDPISIKEKRLEGMWHGYLHVSTFGIDFLVVHLSPADWAFRKREADIIVTTMKNIEGDPIIMLGDFNAHSPMDADLDRKNKALLARYKRGDANNEKYDNLNNGYFDYSVMSTFFATSLRDVTLPFIDLPERFSYPAPALVNIWQTESEVNRHHERIDYILCSPALVKQCVYSRVLNGPETRYLSDHYPVLADFVLE